MNPHGTDPSLQGAEPAPPQLDDGFSPPPQPGQPDEAPPPVTAAQVQAMLGEISPF